MGVDYTAVLAVGKEFESKSEAADFLRSAGHELSEDDEDDLYECVPDGLTFQSMDLYSGGWYILGVTLNPRDVEGFRKNFEEATELWDKYFPDSPPDMIHAVRIH